LINENRRNH